MKELLVLGILIIIVFLILYKKSYFTPKLNFLPNNPPPIPIIPENLKNQPMMYENQMYPAKIPWYPETGRPCNGQCGVTGVCFNGVCKMRDQKDTVFNIPV